VFVTKSVSLPPPCCLYISHTHTRTYTHAHARTRTRTNIGACTYRERESQSHFLSHTVTGWRRRVGCLKLQVIFRQTANNYRALLRNMTYKDKASYGSSPPCTLCSSTPSRSICVCLSLTCTKTNMQTRIYTKPHTHIRSRRI